MNAIQNHELRTTRILSNKFLLSPPRPSLAKRGWPRDNVRVPAKWQTSMNSTARAVPTDSGAVLVNWHACWQATHVVWTDRRVFRYLQWQAEKRVNVQRSGSVAPSHSMHAGIIQSSMLPKSTLNSQFSVSKLCYASIIQQDTCSTRQHENSCSSMHVRDIRAHQIFW